MRQASKTMYKIGKIWNLVALGLLALWFVLSLILLIIDAVNGRSVANEVSNMIVALLEAVANILVLIIMPKQEKAMEQDKTAPAPHIVLIVFGAISWNPFLILGGIFGLVANGQESNGDSSEQPKE